MTRINLKTFYEKIGNLDDIKLDSRTSRISDSKKASMANCLNAENGNYSFEHFYILHKNKILGSKNSGKASYVSLVEELCEKAENYNILKSRGCFFDSKEILSDPDSFNEVLFNEYVYTNCNSDLLMLRSIKLFLELNNTKSMNEYYFDYELKADVYQRAVRYLETYLAESSFQIPTTEETINEAKQDFITHYSPDALKNLPEDKILSAIFDNTNSLCNWLEKNEQCRSIFGSISGGYAFMFGLFKQAETGTWIAGASRKSVELTEEEALSLAKAVRDALIEGVNTINQAKLDSVKAYEDLDDKLNNIFSKINNSSIKHESAWIHKYFSIICEDKLSGFHKEDWQRHILRALRIEPSDKMYARSGQISMIQNKLNMHYRQFYDVVHKRFGNPIQFVQIDSSIGDINRIKKWSDQNIICIGWSRLGDLSQYNSDDNFDRAKIELELEKKYYPGNKKRAAQEAVKIEQFYVLDKRYVKKFVPMDGNRPVAIADNIKDYRYIVNKDDGHQRDATWHFVFDDNDILPEEEKTCQIKKESNLMFLYEKYFYSNNNKLSDLDVASLNKGKDEEDFFITGYHSDFSRNRIVFGAPGTGKSFTVNKEKDELLDINNKTNYERITFHPDYTYSNFVGTYKPVPAKDKNGDDAITYSYVPGPFIRLFIKAIKSNIAGEKRPFLLIIEEINRANVAAVFGDLFQLLDRNENNVSEYPIHASEDLNYYLKDKHNLSLPYLKLPDNFFIWATMNSADQGVFPLDTAFKRRWDFTYIGIDKEEKDINGKFVTLKTKDKQRFEWNSLRKSINEFLSAANINEDKQLGPYFLSRDIVVPQNGSDIDSDKFCNAFKDKVIMYLFDDAAKPIRARLFKESLKGTSRYSKICEAFDEQGIDIFHDDIKNGVKVQRTVTSTSVDATEVKVESDEAAE